MENKGIAYQIFNNPVRIDKYGRFTADDLYLVYKDIFGERKLINDSILYYEDIGFKRIETPWLVTEAVDSITRPKEVEPFIVQAKKKNLIASGKQSFLYLYLKEYLPKGTFQTVTPCFRNDSFDFTHSKYFIKNELIKTDKVDKYSLEKMVMDAEYFFNTFLKQKFI